MKRSTSPRIYVVASASDGPCKIGYATNIYNRLHNLQLGSPVKLAVWSLWAPIRMTHNSLERLVHQRLSSKLLHGEWFSCTVAEAEEALAGLGDRVGQAATQGELAEAMLCHPRYAAVAIAHN